MHAPPTFLWVTCQVGAEAAVKQEAAILAPSLRFSYSRPGFLTFKLPQDHGLSEDFALDLVFGRAQGFTLGRVAEESWTERVKGVWALTAGQRFDALHVWSRDAGRPGWRGFEPGPSAQNAEVAAAIRAAAPQGIFPELARPATVTADEGRAATPLGARVLDCIVVGEREWWVGVHRVHDWPSAYPGALRPAVLPPQAVSRAYLKMQEALDWGGLPMTAGDRVTEIGCAPGGSAQALLERGLVVTGIDPAPMHTDVLSQSNFTHVRKRGADVRRREFRKTRWLVADMNVAPNYTLDTVEAIVTHPEVRVRGLILTLKLLEWKLAGEVPAWLERIRGWGYAVVKARQLQHNRQEICVVALRRSVGATTRAKLTRASARPRTRRRSPPRGG